MAEEQQEPMEMEDKEAQQRPRASDEEKRAQMEAQRASVTGEVPQAATTPVAPASQEGGDEPQPEQQSSGETPPPGT